MPITHKWNGTVLTITSDSGSSSMNLKGEKGDDGIRGPVGRKGDRGGGALINDNTISKDEVWSSSGLMDRFAESMSYEGNPITCNPLPNLPFDIITDIEVKQEGSGNPYPAGGGKNILPPCPQFEETVSGITITSNGEGKYTVKGTATNTVSVLKYLKHTTKLGDKVVVHLMNNNVNTNSSISYYRPDGKQITWTTINAVNRIQDNPTLTNETVSVLGFYVAAGETVDITLTPMILTDETPTAFIHYENIRPIIGMDAVSVVRCGTQILDDKNLNGIVLDTMYRFNSPFLTSGTYTVSINITGGTEQGITFALRHKTGNIKEYVVSNGKPAVIEITEDILKQIDNCTIYTWSGSVGATLDWIMINEGDTALPYEPYKGDTYTMELGQTVYSGSIDWNRGVMVVDNAVLTLDGTETSLHTHDGWAAGTFDIHDMLLNAVSVDGYVAKANIICSHLPVATPADMANDRANIGVGQGQTNVIFARISKDYNTVELIRDYLAAQYAAGTPIQILYKLAEPQEIPLTPQLIRAIKGTNTLYTDADKMTVFGRVDTMATIKALTERVAALEAAMGGE